MLSFVFCLVFFILCYCCLARQHYCAGGHSNGVGGPGKGAGGGAWIREEPKGKPFMALSCLLSLVSGGLVACDCHPS